jgi:hypothetical protein
MKIKEEDFEVIKKACLDTLKAYGKHPYIVQSTRRAWDVFNRASDEGRINVFALYKKYNDQHIETALRAIFRR